MFIVLTPVRQHFAYSQSLLHIGNNQILVLIFQQSCQRMGKGYALH